MTRTRVHDRAVDSLGNGGRGGAGAEEDAADQDEKEAGEDPGDGRGPTEAGDPAGLKVDDFVTPGNLERVTLKAMCD